MARGSEIIGVIIAGAVAFGMFALVAAVSWHIGYREGWTVGSACTAVANPASAGNVSHGLGACASPL